MSSPPPPPREIRPELSPEVEAVLLKALEKKPGDRYQSGRALALALERAVRRQQAQLPPARRSIPERVTVGLAANPLPPIPAVVTPPKEPAAQAAAAEVNERLTVPPLADNQSVPATIQFLNPEMPRQPAHSEPAASAPVRQETTSNRWPLWAAAALVSLCIVGCLAVTVLTVVLRSKEMLAAAQATAASPAANIGKATLTSPPKTNTLPAPKSPAEAQVTSTPTATASPQPVAEADEFFLTFWRCDDEGCLVVANDGDHPFPMGRLQIKAKKLTFSGGEWGIEWLEPGQCVTAVKNEDWVRRMPEDIDCTLVGSPIVREGRERFWEGDFTVIFEDQKAAECRKKSERCEMEIER